MRIRILLGLVLFLMPLNVFAQTARELYQESKALEFEADREKGPNKINGLSLAFSKMAEAAIANSQYVAAFAAIARKYVAQSSGSSMYWDLAVTTIQVGEKRSSHPEFRKVAGEIATVFKAWLLKQGYGPGRSFVQRGRRSGYSHCNFKR